MGKYELHNLSVINDSLYRYLEIENIEPKAKETVSKNLEAYFDFLAAEKKEAAAHFAHLYLQKTYPEAVGFIARECSILTMSMIIYVQGISAA